jgi:hypothetical protein
MSEDILRTVKKLLATGKGDSKRLREIFDIIKRGDTVVMSDYRYIQSLTLEEPNQGLEKKPISTGLPVKRDPSLELLRTRLAEGQITINEFKAMKKALTENDE